MPTALLPGRFLYLGTPRTASTAVGNALCRQLGAIPQPQRATVSEVRGWRNEPRFTTVRNPYDVLVSWYVRMRFDRSGTSLSEFLRTYENRDFARDGDLFWQCGDGVRVTHWEHLERDVNDVLYHLGMPGIRLSDRENLTPRKKPWRDYYEDDPEAVAAANARFGHEVERWGYERL